LRLWSPTSVLDRCVPVALRMISMPATVVMAPRVSLPGASQNQA
jgi:hypothetical protein